MLGVAASRLARSAGISGQLPLAAVIAQRTNGPGSVQNSKACFASAASAATKEGSEAKKEAKKSALEYVFSALKASYCCQLSTAVPAEAALQAA